MHGKIIAGMLFFLFFFPSSCLLSLPSSLFYPFLLFLSLISCSWLILTLCCAAHLLQVDFVNMHGKCTMRDLRGVPHVRGMCDKSYPGPACKTVFKMDQSWCCFCVLVYHPPLPPLSPSLSPSSSFFFFSSLILLTFISDPCLVVQHSTRTTACSLRTAQHPCAPPMTAVSPSAVGYVCD